MRRIHCALSDRIASTGAECSLISNLKLLCLTTLPPAFAFCLSPSDGFSPLAMAIYIRMDYRFVYVMPASLFYSFLELAIAALIKRCAQGD